MSNFVPEQQSQGQCGAYVPRRLTEVAKRKFVVGANGLSAPIAQILCRGMHYGDPREQSLHELKTLRSLPHGTIQTEEDVRAIEKRLKRCSKLLPVEANMCRRLLRGRNLGISF